MIRYFVLVPVVVLSFLSMYLNNLFVFGGEERTYRFMMFLPGIFFSAFIIYLHLNQFSRIRLFVYFCLLNIIYILAFFAGIASWGIFVPIIGAFGALCIRYIFYFNSFSWDSFDTAYFVLGLISSGIGLGIFYNLSDDIKYKVGFGLIIALWQLMIGIVCIQQVETDETRIKKLG